MTRRWTGVVMLAALTATTACRAGAADEPRATHRAERPTCEATFRRPAGYRLVDTHEVNLRDHIGVRLAFRDRRHRQLYVFSGVPGEFGEGLPPTEVLTLGTEDRVWLVGRRGTWVVAWDEGGPCGSRAVIGDGLTKEAFLRALRRAGVT
jgi:hypothetical protein